MQSRWFQRCIAVVFVLACSAAGFSRRSGSPLRPGPISASLSRAAAGVATTTPRTSARRVGVSNAAYEGPRAAGRVRTFVVDSDYTEYAENVDGTGCTGLATPTPSCFLTFRGQAAFTKSIRGVQHFVCAGDTTQNPRTDGKLAYTCTGVVFTATVRGCGTGTFVADETDGYIDFAKLDPKTENAPAFNRWKLRAGSGTGQLRNLISGSGENHWTEHVIGEADTTRYSGTGHFSGRITCRV